MITHFMEASQGEGVSNWGKFLLARFDRSEWGQRSHLPGRAKGSPLLGACGWDPAHLLVMDLQTGEGAIFLPGGWAQADLEKHRVWVCPMFEPFLDWLWRQDVSDITTLPKYVEIPEAPFAMAGYRREGPDGV